MTCSSASRLLAVLFLVTAISSGALAAPTPIPPVTTDSDLVLEARALRSHPDQTSHSLTTLQRRRGEYTSVVPRQDLIFEHRDGKEVSGWSQSPANLSQRRRYVRSHSLA
ncbi:hypothetical protein FB446DRAFT_454113 [Lentinula raphanica]|nr:hypothetical protein FB446DRAFT_454113 [Lentinula raphanica]